MDLVWPGVIVAAFVAGAIAMAIPNLLLKSRLRRLVPRPDDVPWALSYLCAEYLQGRINPEALAALRACASPGMLLLWNVNEAVCMEIAAGRYVEALTWRAVCPPARLRGEGELLLRINEAEAMANLGRIEESLAWINRSATAPGLTSAGSAAHRAWCLAMLKRPAEAEQALSEDTPENLPEPYRSEWYLSKAAAAIAGRKWEDASAALADADELASRASSVRNVHFTRGLLFAAQGLPQEALPHFEAGAKHPYAGQGGDALLSWGETLALLGRQDDARQAWSLCVERDSQSPAAAVARTRLESGEAT
jgi:tetratricopeptide (TPR) repeat protein